MSIDGGPVLVTLIALGLLPQAEAATLEVCASGCVWNDLSAAIVGSSPGDEIVVGAGTWPVTMPIPHDLTVRAATPGTAFLDGAGDYAFTLDTPVAFELDGLHFGPGPGRILHATATADITLTDVHAQDYDPAGHLVKMAAGGTLTVLDSSFTGLQTGYATDGAVFWLGGGAGVLGDFDGVEVSGASAIRGGAVFLSTGLFSVRNSTFTGNDAVDLGGAFYVDFAAVLSVEDSAFDANLAGSSGGHLFAAGATALFRSEFTNGQALGPFGGGGAVSVPQLVEDCTFTGNHADGEGGAVYAAGSVTITGSDFVSNTAEAAGGAIRANTGDPGQEVVVSGSSFTSNQTLRPDSYGGAIYMDWDGSFSLSDAVFTGNSAGDRGGALQRSGTGGTTVDNVLFEGNLVTGDAGGAVSLSYGSVLGVGEPHVFTDVTFSANSAFRGGGLSLFGPGASHVENSLFCDNSVGQDGGAILVGVPGTAELDTLTVTNSVFHRNLASASGGALHSRADVDLVTLLNNDFLGNQAGLYGAAVTLWTNGAIDVRNNLFGWNTLAEAALYEKDTVGAATVDHNGWWENSPVDVLGSPLPGMGPNAVTSDPQLTEYDPNATCGDWDLVPLPDSPLIDGGDPSISDADGSPSDVGVTGGPGGDDGPGYSPGTGTGTGTGGTATGTVSTTLPDADGDGHAVPWDCDDSDPEIHPDARERANDGKDNDCDGVQLESWLGGRACDHGSGGPWGLLLLLLGLRRSALRG